MKFNLTKEFIEEITEDIGADNAKGVIRHIENLHPADIADLLEELSEEDAKTLFGMLTEDLAAEVLIEIEGATRKGLLKTLTSSEIAKQFIDKLDSDDAADVIGELSDNMREEVIGHLEDSGQASYIIDLLHYGEDTAGGLMAKELVAANENWTVTTCVDEVRRQAENIENIYAVYVIDNQRKLLGLLPLDKLVIAAPDAVIGKLYDEEVISVKARTKSEEVGKIMAKYDLVVIPVVDELGRLLGRITIDDVVDVIRDEAEKDYQMASGIAGDFEPSDSVWVRSKARLPWLFIGLLGGILGAHVIGMYENEIRIYPEMAFFIPLIAAMGGNVGVQSSAIIVQGLASHTIVVESIISKIGKEFGVAMFNGLMCSLLILAYNYFFVDSMKLSITISTALLSVILFAGIFGTVVPLILNKYKIDPALATGPFITTTNDILGMLMYFGIGRMMHG